MAFLPAPFGAGAFGQTHTIAYLTENLKGNKISAACFRWFGNMPQFI